MPGSQFAIDTTKRAVRNKSWVIINNCMKFEENPPTEAKDKEKFSMDRQAW